MRYTFTLLKKGCLCAAVNLLVNLKVLVMGGQNVLMVGQPALLIGGQISTPSYSYGRGWHPSAHVVVRGSMFLGSGFPRSLQPHDITKSFYISFCGGYSCNTVRVFIIV